MYYTNLLIKKFFAVSVPDVAMASSSVEQNQLTVQVSARSNSEQSGVVCGVAATHDSKPRLMPVTAGVKHGQVNN